MPELWKVIDYLFGLVSSNLGIITVVGLAVCILIETLADSKLIGKKILDSGFRKDEIEDKQHSIIDEIEKLSSDSLTFGGLVLTSLSIILTLSAQPYQKTIVDISFAWVFSISLLLISYKLHVFSGIKRFYYLMQKRLFRYGILSMFIGLYWFFIWMVFSTVSIMFWVLIIMAILNFLEYRTDLKILTSNNKKRSS
ncbi:MAG: hypothetical protein HY516_02080 [Candidatus Aenigmarchaeota archaeon]|nr:hypothetical protein [Candidatus Aenigmarchaeota archaeon]